MSALGMSLGVPFVIMAAAAPAAGVSQSSAAPVEERAFQTNPTSQSGPRIFDATSARGVADGKPVQPGELFTPEENPIYVWFRHEGCAEGATITSNWHYLGSQPPLHIAEARATVGPAANSGQFNFELAPGKAGQPDRLVVKGYDNADAGNFLGVYEEGALGRWVRAESYSDKDGTFARAAQRLR